MNIKQHKFVTEYLRFQDKIVAYNNAYPNPKRNGRTTESAANRLMQKPEIAQIIADALDTTMYVAREELKNQMKEELLTVYQKRLLCRRVVLGEVREEITVRGKDCNQCTHYREISYNTKLRYSREDSLLAGHYIHGKNSPPVPRRGEWRPASGGDSHSGVVEPQTHTAPQHQEIENTIPQQTATNERVNSPQQACPPQEGVTPVESGEDHSSSTNTESPLEGDRGTNPPQETTHVTQSTPGSATPAGGGQNTIPQQQACPPQEGVARYEQEDVHSRQTQNTINFSQRLSDSAVKKENHTIPQQNATNEEDHPISITQHQISHPPEPVPH